MLLLVRVMLNSELIDAINGTINRAVNGTSNCVVSGAPHGTIAVLLVIHWIQLFVLPLDQPLVLVTSFKFLL